MKPEHRDMLRRRAERALCDMYHNATLPFDFDSMPAVIFEYLDIANECDYFDGWLSDTASFEIDYINDGGVYGPDYEDTLRASYNAGKYTSRRAQNYFVHRHMNKMRIERARYARWECITEYYGKVYQWGRGGRTLAPDALIRQHGGSTFGINYDVAITMSAENLTELCLTVESFNALVKATCNAFPEMWRNHLRDLMTDVVEHIETENERTARALEAERPDMYGEAT